MENLQDGFSTVAGLVGTVGIDEGIFSTRQEGVISDNDGANLASGAEDFTGRLEGREHEG